MWETIIQAVVLTICTAYLRNAGRSDSADVVFKAVSRETGNDILARVVKLEKAIEQMRIDQIAATGIDHRGPSKP